MKDHRLTTEQLELCLPERLVKCLYELSAAGRFRAADISELRLRLNRPASVTVAGVNLPLDVRLTATELSDAVTAFCHGSYYAHGDTIREGYIRFGDGCRIGVCGSVSTDGDVYEITSVNIRVPHIIRGVSDYLVRRCLDSGRIGSLLIFSPPGIGKTTLLRDLASRLGGEFGRRVAVIDTRGELYIDEMYRDTLCDFLIGYPRAKGIELATRSLSPEVLICDELGDADEARAILTAQNTGVPLIASAHAASISGLLARPNIRLLHSERVFDCYVSVAREKSAGRLSRCFTFSCVTRDEAEELICRSSSAVS